MLNFQFEIVLGDEFVTSIDHYDEFHVNLLFDRSIYRPMCTHRDQYTELTLEKNQHITLQMMFMSADLKIQTMAHIGRGVSMSTYS